MGKRILVDVERGRTVRGWKPRRLGGGLGGRPKPVEPSYGGGSAGGGGGGGDRGRGGFRGGFDRGRGGFRGVDVDLAEDVGEDTETEEDSVTGLAVVSEVEAVAASEEAGMTLDRRGVEVAIGAGVVVWATTVEDSTTARLQAGTEACLDPVVGPVDQVGMVLLAGVQVTVLPLPAAVALVVMEVTEDISSERAQEVSTTGTQSAHDTRFWQLHPSEDV
ncbi:hypothetical protein BJV74DRAFT_176804 [Russula compacta]|nr:hypothetical protein BJV74DRAFT_176804 [Russula compacta]